MRGKIIAVVGAPGSGKSFLVKKLKEYLNAEAFFEGEEKDLPEKIIENLSKQVNNFETILWFRNQRIKDFLKALELKEKGKNIILDTFWITNQFHINSMLNNFEKKVALDLGALDLKSFPMPDLIIFLKIEEKDIRKSIKLRARNFDQNESFIKRILSINKEHKDFFKKNKFKNLLIIDKNKFDFSKEKDFYELIKKITNSKIIIQK